MICSQCGRTYLVKEKDSENLKNLSGLCPNCGTKPKYKAFLNSFGIALFTSFLFFEILTFAFFSSDFASLGIVLLCLLILLGIASVIVLQGEKVSYDNAHERAVNTRLQRFFAWLLGMLLVMLSIYATFIYRS